MRQQIRVVVEPGAKFLQAAQVIRQARAASRRRLKMSQ